MTDNAHVTQEFVSSVIAGEAFADASLLGSLSGLLSSYDLAASCSTTLYADLYRLKDFGCCVSSFLLPALLGGVF